MSTELAFEVPAVTPSVTNHVQDHEAPMAERCGQRLEWSGLMASAQAGDRQAYRRLLEAVAPYLRSLALRRLNDRSDAEDVVQDILLTVHSIRHTYDPKRPFGPWLVAIANRRIVDRVRKRDRQTRRESPRCRRAMKPLTTLRRTFPKAAWIATPCAKRSIAWRRLSARPCGSSS